MASNWKYLLITVGTIGAGWALMKGTVPSKDQMMEVILLAVYYQHELFTVVFFLENVSRKT